MSTKYQKGTSFKAYKRVPLDRKVTVVNQIYFVLPPNKKPYKDDLIQ